MTSKTLFPFIQTHQFYIDPFMPEAQGYAPFLASDKFSGNEVVRFVSLNSEKFPDIDSSERVLNLYENGKWCLSDSDRLNSATKGPLSDGLYGFIVEYPDKDAVSIEVDFKATYVEPADYISLLAREETLEISWEKPRTSDSFWVFAIPVNANNFFDELISLTSNNYEKTVKILQKKDLPPGEYRIAIRTNRILNAPVKGYISEAWSLSREVFSIKR